MAWLTQSRLEKLILKTLFTHATIVITLRTCSIYSSLLNTILLPLTAETKILRPGFTKKKPSRRFILCNLQSQVK